MNPLAAGGRNVGPREAQNRKQARAGAREPMAAASAAGFGATPAMRGWSDRVDPQAEGGIERLYALEIGSLWSALTRERASFLLLCFYVFLEYVRPQTAYPVIDVIPWAQTAILLTVTFFALEGNRVAVRNPENALMVLFLIAVVLSSALAYSPADSFQRIDVFLAWFIVYFLVINLVNTEAKLFVFLCLYLLWNFKMTQHGFLSWAGRGFAFADWGVTGAPGWFHNSGEFGVQLCIIIPLAIYFVAALREHWGKLKLLAVLALPFTAIASVIATSSRGALVGAAAALLWMAVVSKRRLAVVLLMLVPLALIVYKSIPEQSLARFETVGADVTSQARLKRWKDGVEIMRDNPVLGVGYANWDVYYTAHYWPKPGQALGLPHNIFIDAGAELGYLGLGLFILMILFAFVNNRRTRKAALAANNRFLYYLAHAFDAGMVGFLVSASFVSVLFYPCFWMLLAFTVALNNVAQNAVYGQEQGKPWESAGSVRVGGPRASTARLTAHAVLESTESGTNAHR